MTSTSNAPRSLPLQARSKATVEQLLSVALTILDEEGLEAFNTNLLAEKAGVGVRAIYRYFPNKLAILIVLVERMREREREWIGDFTRLAGTQDWREAVGQSIDCYFAAAAKQPGMVALRAAIRVVPELHDIEVAASERFQKDLAAALKTAGVDIDRGHMKALCQTIIESSATLLDAALMSPPAHAKRLLDELKHMIHNLLADYIPG